MAFRHVGQDCFWGSQDARHSPQNMWPLLAAQHSMRRRVSIESAAAGSARMPHATQPCSLHLTSCHTQPFSLHLTS
eukprot:1139105-Pelagomonas_calceolata.AAC.3